MQKTRVLGSLLGEQIAKKVGRRSSVLQILLKERKGAGVGRAAYTYDL